MDTVEQITLCPSCGHKNPVSARFCQNDGFPLRDGDPNDPLAGRLVGNYRLLERKGEGGFGVVYLAEHNNLKTRFAVKILHPQFSANRHIAERFRREALTAGKMRHEHVVSIADFDHAPGVGYYYVMEYLQGKTLKSSLDDGEEFSAGRILHIARQVTSAMERVHSLHIIHRDLKPENIFLLEKGGISDYVKLVDFGIAKLMDEEGSSLTRTGLSVGTPLYMSPEQARGQLKALDHRTDIYSWGVILFEMLTYRPPFFSENPHEVVMMQIREMPPRLAEVCPERQFSPALEEFIRRILAKNPLDRPVSMPQMYSELEEILSAPGAFLDSGMTQMVEQREHWIHANGVTHITPTVLRSTREVLEEEKLHHALESTGEQLYTSPEKTIEPYASDLYPEDTPDWRSVLSQQQMEEVQRTDTSDTIAGTNMTQALAQANAKAMQASQEPQVDVNMMAPEEDSHHLSPSASTTNETFPHPPTATHGRFLRPPLSSEEELPRPPLILEELPPPPLVEVPSDLSEALFDAKEDVTRPNVALLTDSKSSAFQLAPPLDDKHTQKTYDESELPAKKTVEEPSYDPKKTLEDPSTSTKKTIEEPPISFSTDPDALRSPLARYGWMIGVTILGFVALVGALIYWMRHSKTEPDIDYRSLMNRVRQTEPPQRRAVLGKTQTTPSPQSLGKTRLGVSGQTSPAHIRPVAVPARASHPSDQRDVSARTEPGSSPRVHQRPVDPRITPQQTPQARLPSPSGPDRMASVGLKQTIPSRGEVRVSLSIDAQPSDAHCFLRNAEGEWERFDSCSLWRKVGETVEIRVVAEGYLSQSRIWLPQKNASWSIQLRKKMIRRVRPRPQPKKVEQVPRRAPPPRRQPAVRGDSIFDQTDNPFQDKKNPKDHKK